MNILVHNFASVLLKKYFKKYKDLGINIFHGEIALADAELETNNLSFLLASVFQNLVCKQASITELRVSIPWGDKSREGSVFAKGIHIKLEFSEKASTQTEKDSVTISPSVVIGGDEDNNAASFFDNIRKNVVIVLRDLCIEIAITDKITAQLKVDYIKIMPFLSKKCKKIEVEGISFSLTDPENGFETLLERIDGVVLTILSDVDTFVLDFHLHNRLGFKFAATNQSYKTLITLQTFFQKISKPFQEFEYLVFLKDSKERRLSINLNFNEFSLIAKLEDQHIALKLNHPNYNVNIEYPKYVTSTYITFFSLELKWNDKLLCSMYNLRQIESPAQAEFQMQQINSKMNTGFLINLTEESSEMNRMTISTKNCCINSIEVLVDLQELLQTINNISSFISTIHKLVENTYKGLGLSAQPSNSTGARQNIDTSLINSKKYSTIWEIDFLQNSIKLPLKRPNGEGTDDLWLIVSGKILLNARGKGIRLKERIIGAEFQQFHLFDSNKDIMLIPKSFKIRYDMASSEAESSKLTFSAQALILKLTHNFLRPCYTVSNAFKKAPQEVHQQPHQQLSADSSSSSESQNSQISQQDSGILRLKLMVAIDKIVLELGEQLETHTSQGLPLKVFQNILLVQLKQTELEMAQLLRVSVKSFRVNIQHPWYNIRLPFVELSSILYEYNFKDTNTHISISQDATIKVNDLCINALQSLSGLISSNTSAMAKFCNLTSHKILLVSKDFAKQDITREIESGKADLIQLCYNPVFNEYSIGFPQDNESNPFVFTNKHKIPELKADQELNILGEYLEKYYVRPFYKPESKQVVAFGLCHQHYIVNFLSTTLTVVFPKNNGLSNGEVTVPSLCKELRYSLFTDKINKDDSLEILQMTVPFELSRTGLRTKKVLIKCNETGSYYTTRELSDINQSVIYLYDINSINSNQPAFHLVAHQKGGICIWEVNSLVHIENRLCISGKVELKFFSNVNGNEYRSSIVLNPGENILSAGKHQFFNQYFDLSVQILDSGNPNSPQIGPPIDHVIYNSESIKLKGFSIEVAELLKEKTITRDVPLNHLEDPKHLGMVRVQTLYERSKICLSINHLFMITNNTPFNIEISYSKKCSPIGLEPGQSKQSLLHISSIAVMNVLLVSDDFEGVDSVPVQMKNFLKAHYCIVSFADTLYKSQPTRIFIVLRLSKNTNGVITLTLDPVIEFTNNSTYALSFDPLLNIPIKLLGYAFPVKKANASVTVGHASYYSVKESLKSIFFDFIKKDGPFLFIMKSQDEAPVLGLAIQDLFNENHFTFETGICIDTLKLSVKWTSSPVLVQLDSQLEKEIIVKNESDVKFQFGTSYYGSGNIISMFEIKGKTRNKFYLPEPSAKLSQIRGILLLEDKRYDLEDGSKFNNIGIKCKMFRTNKTLIYTIKPRNTEKKIRTSAETQSILVETRGINIELSIFGINEVDIIIFQPLEIVQSKKSFKLSSVQFKIIRKPAFQDETVIGDVDFDFSVDYALTPELRLVKDCKLSVKKLSIKVEDELVDFMKFFLKCI